MTLLSLCFMFAFSGLRKHLTTVFKHSAGCRFAFGYLSGIGLCQSTTSLFLGRCTLSDAYSSLLQKFGLFRFSGGLFLSDSSFRLASAISGWTAALTRILLLLHLSLLPIQPLSLLLSRFRTRGRALVRWMASLPQLTEIGRAHV